MSAVVLPYKYKKYKDIRLLLSYNGVGTAQNEDILE